MSYRLGIDLGGTKIEAVIIDEQFQVVKRERVPTNRDCLLYTSPSPRDKRQSRMPSSA